MKKIWWSCLCISIIVLLAACSSAATPKQASTQALTNNVASHGQPQDNVLPTQTPTPPMSIPAQVLTPTPKAQGHSAPASGCVTFSNDTTHVPAKNGGLAAPYGSAPTSSLAQQFTTQLLQLINHERALCGLPAFTWNQTLANGALLHSWNMAHCGFSHTCPDGMSQCQRIANEGFANRTDCGECIGGAGGTWSSVYSIQESMEHESVTGWHRIHLFSTTLHYIGIGVYIDSSGYVWFTEDLVS